MNIQAPEGDASRGFFNAKICQKGVKSAMSGMKLTAKQKRFVEEYLVDLNATQAAIRAGYSVDSARDIGCENLTKPNIQAAVGKAMAERSKRTGINQDRVVLELAKVAFVNVADVVDLTDGSILNGASTDDLACIEGIKYKRSDTDTGSSEEREIKFASKMKALELLGKHLGMWDDKAEVNVNIPVVISGEESLED